MESNKKASLSVTASKKTPKTSSLKNTIIYLNVQLSKISSYETLDFLFCF